MKVSIIIAVLDSHEIVRRQVEYFKRMGLPSCVEFIIVDDGSEPAIEIKPCFRNIKLLATHDRRRWTQGLARMRGVDEAKGEYILCTDIDHIVSKEALDFAIGFCGDKAVFHRRFAYLDENGELVTDKDKVLAWGLNPNAMRHGELRDGVHGNTWLMKRSIFMDLGGYNRERCESGTHLQGEDREFNKRWSNARRAGTYQEQVTGPDIYFFPMGKYHIADDENPFGLFHGMVKERWGNEKANEKR